MTRPDLRTAHYQAHRATLIGRPCWTCGRPATTADHQPPVALWNHHHPGQPWQGQLLPACTACNAATGGWALVHRLRRLRHTQGTPRTTRGSRWT